MKIRCWAEFCADFPDDQIEEGDEIIQYSGKGVAEAAAAILAGLGCKVTEPADLAELGWEFDVDLDRRKLWCRISDLGESIYLVLKRHSIDSFFSPNEDVYVRILKGLDDGLRADPRFRDLVWRSQAEMDASAPGADHPVSDSP